MADNVTLGLAFLAGLVSFVSPCVLPLVPAYIGYMGGRMTHRVAAKVAGGANTVTATNSLADRFNTVLHGMAFVVGFTFIFVLLGLLTTAFFSIIGGSNIALMTDIIGRVGGVLIIFFGLHFMGVLPSVFAWLRERPNVLGSTVTTFVVAAVGSLLIVWAFWISNAGVDLTAVQPQTLSLRGALLGLPLVAALLLWLFLGGALTEPGRFWVGMLDRLENAFYSDTRRQMVASTQQGLGGSALMGLVFAAGWTPCIGPIYGAVLTLAANTGDVVQATPLLIAYSLGLGIPFLLTALLLDSAQGILRRLQRHMRTIELVSGAFLVFIGVLVATGRLQELSQRAAAQFADLSIRVETCIVGSAAGELNFNQIGSCLNSRLVPLASEVGSTGTLNAENPKMEFVYRAQAGEAIDIQIKAVGDIHAEGAPVPLADNLYNLTLLDPTGSEIVSSDDMAAAISASGSLMPIHGVTLTQDGIYSINVTSVESTTDEHAFTVIVMPVDAALTNEMTAPSTGSVSTIEGLAASADPVTGIDIGNRAPDFLTILDDGTAVNLSDLRGQVVLLNFWATWCGPCRIEMPEFEKAFLERSDEGFTILAVNNRETLEDVIGFREEMAVTFPMALDESGEIQGQFAVRAYPSTYLIGRDGVIITRHFGPLTAAQIQQLVDEALSN